MELKWDDKLLLGVDETDDHHKNIYKVVDSLINAIVVKSSDDEINRIFVFLEKHMEKHFTVEEDCMRKYNYPSEKPCFITNT